MTAIELLVVLAIGAILLTVAVPSFVSLTQSNRVAGEINAFVGDLQFARAEAIKQGQPVTVCASSDGLNCLGAPNWQSGWIVFADPDSSQTRSSTELVIRKQPSWTSTDTFTASNGVSAFTYSRDGFAVSLPGTVTLTLHTSPLNANATRCVAVNLVGRQLVQTVNGSNCT